MNKKEVSIILPTYNREYIVGKAIESVLKQTYTDFELLIILTMKQMQSLWQHEKT